MVLFIILAIIFMILALILVFGIGIAGAGAIVVFGDVIVCMALIVLIMRSLIKSRKKKK